MTGRAGEDAHIELAADALELDIEVRAATPATGGHPRPPVTLWLGAVPAGGRGHTYLDGTVLATVLRHGMSSRQREVGGVLVGYLREDAGPYGHVVGAIAARHAQERAARLTFTHQSWEHLLAEKARDFPDTVILGWYHTHPGHGIFLSGYDTYIHQNFFGAPHQVALVFDPQAPNIGLFRWQAGSLVPCSIPICGQLPITPAQIAELRQLPARGRETLRVEQSDPDATPTAFPRVTPREFAVELGEEVVLYVTEMRCALAPVLEAMRHGDATAPPARDRRR